MFSEMKLYGRSTIRSGILACRRPLHDGSEEAAYAGRMLGERKSSPCITELSQHLPALRNSPEEKLSGVESRSANYRQGSPNAGSHLAPYFVTGCSLIVPAPDFSPGKRIQTRATHLSSKDLALALVRIMVPAGLVALRL